MADVGMTWKSWYGNEPLHLAFPEDASLTLKLARAAHQVGELAFCGQLLKRLEARPLPDEELAQAMALRDALAAAAAK